MGSGRTHAPSHTAFPTLIRTNRRRSRRKDQIQQQPHQLHSPTAPSRIGLAMSSLPGQGSSPHAKELGENSSLAWGKDEAGSSKVSSSTNSSAADRESGKRDPRIQHDSSNASPREGSAAAAHETNEGQGRVQDGSDVVSDGLLPSATTIPQRFSCSRCAKCKHQSKGTFYCRVILLHLFAPSWEDADQSKAWEIPRGFLKWLRREGPVERCEVRPEASLRY